MKNEREFDGLNEAFTRFEAMRTKRRLASDRKSEEQRDVGTGADSCYLN